MSEQVSDDFLGEPRPPTWIDGVERTIRLSVDSITRLHRDGLIRPAEPTTDATGADPNRTDGLGLWAGRRDRTIAGARWPNDRHAEQGYMALPQYRELLNEAGLPGDNEAFLSRVIDDGARQGRLLKQWPLVGASLTEEIPQPADSLTGEDKALALLIRHPKWSDTKIAKAVPCHRTTLYKWPTYRKACEALKSARNDMPQGSKDGETGTVEAW